MDRPTSINCGPLTVRRSDLGAEEEGALCVDVAFEDDKVEEEEDEEEEDEELDEDEEEDDGIANTINGKIT